MTTYYMTPIATILQYFSDSGIVLNGGKVNTYLAGTSTPQATKTDSTGAVDNANPIILNAAGRLPSVSIWQAQGIKLKIIITDANNNPIGSPIDQVAGIDDPTDLLATLASNSTGSGADLIANAVRSFDLISTVRAAGSPTLVAGQTRVIDIEAGTTPDDGFGGLFYWSASSTATDDGVYVIKPTSVSGAGRYLRQAQVSSGTFVGQFIGCTTNVQTSFTWRQSGNSVSLALANTSADVTGVSNSTTFGVSYVSGSYIPAIGGNFVLFGTAYNLIDNSTVHSGIWGASNSGIITFGLGFDGGNFTAANNKGFNKRFLASYTF